MNILFDLIASQPQNNLKYHGGSEYTKVVFKAVVQKSPASLVCIYDSGRFIDNEITLLCQKKNLPLIDISKSVNIDSVIEEYNIDRFYTALPLDKEIQHLLPFSKKVKSIITIHGLRSLELLSDDFELKYTIRLYHQLKYFYKMILPADYERKLLVKMRLLIRNYNNPTIVTVSNHSKWSLKYFMPEIPGENIQILYSPFSDYIQTNSDNTILLKNNLEPKKYFLLLSAGIWQKNSYRMLSAFRSLIKNGLTKGYKLVVIGALQGIRDRFQNESFIYLDYLERHDLEVLLLNAFALLYPSLNEGFGYPPLEALKYGTGVIASAIGPVLEVCGNSALYFNPYSITEMKSRLLQSLNDPGFITDSKDRIDRYKMIRQKQKNDLELLVNLICN